NYTHSIFTGSEMAPVANLDLRAGTMAAVKANFPGWMASIDKFSGKFSDIYGKAMPVSGNTNAERAAQLLNGKLKNMGIEATEWQNNGAHTASHAGYVYYNRMVQGHEVVFANLMFKFTPAGELIRIKGNAYGAPGNETNASLS